MKKIFLFTLSLVYIFGIQLSEIQEKLKHPYLEGIFIQEKYIQNFPNPITTKGKFIIDQETLLWEVQKPIKNTVKITQGGIYILDNQGKWHRKENQYDKQFFLNIIRFDFEELQKNFQIEIADKDQQWNITLMPLGLILPKIFKNICIYGKNYVQKVILKESNGDETVITFKDIKEK